MAAMFNNLYLHDSYALKLDTNVLDTLDSANPITLYTIWAIISRCADSVEQGRRLENRAWRLWKTAQTLERAIKKPATSTAIANLPSYTIPNKNCAETRNGEVPGLSHSVGSLTGGSLTDTETVGFTSVSRSPEGRTRIKGQRLRTPGSIGTKEQSLEQVPDNSYTPSLSPDGTESQVLHQSGPASEASSQDSLPEPSSSPAPKPVQPKQLARFALGGSCSSSEQS
ncbi:hypothetical protein J3459_018165 [Metarhizium acridum]|uniref:uncharacterized protein n=1 Tax=Metarhizium acridum TaxID=92637 RepID=UPI001C6C00E9|nr:hypothetical protein J3459_018165 [Metarhizium acridum]KAG8410901.1 hypothetical protein J3458_016467 [Metarhizium acridum]